MTRRLRFTEEELARAIRGAASGGLTPSKVAIAPDGTITLWFGEDDPDGMLIDQYINLHPNR